MRSKAQKDGPEHQALLEVLKVFNDNQSELARRLNEHLMAQDRGDERVQQNTISWWLHRSYRVPAELARDIEHVSGVAAERLLPQVFRVTG